MSSASSAERRPFCPSSPAMSCCFACRADLASRCASVRSSRAFRRAVSAVRRRSSTCSTEETWSDCIDSTRAESRSASSRTRSRSPSASCRASWRTATRPFSSSHSSVECSASARASSTSRCDAARTSSAVRADASAARQRSSRCLSAEACSECSNPARVSSFSASSRARSRSFSDSFNAASSDCRLSRSMFCSLFASWASFRVDSSCCASSVTRPDSAGASPGVAVSAVGWEARSRSSCLPVSSPNRSATRRSSARSDSMRAAGPPRRRGHTGVASTVTASPRFGGEGRGRPRRTRIPDSALVRPGHDAVVTRTDAGDVLFGVNEGGSLEAAGGALHELRQRALGAQRPGSEAESRQQPPAALRRWITDRGQHRRRGAPLADPIQEPGEEAPPAPAPSPALRRRARRPRAAVRESRLVDWLLLWGRSSQSPPALLTLHRSGPQISPPQWSAYAGLDPLSVI